MNQLPHCTGSPLSINSLREDLQVAHKTVSKWVKILERMYYLFLLPPMSGPKIRAVKKEQKSYFYDWTLNLDEGAKFENLVALHLLKHVYFMEDSQGENMELRYFRDTDAREVDFVLLKNGLPLMFIECKLGDQMISPHLKYLCAKYPKVDAYQISLNGHKDYQTPDGIRVCPAHLLLKNLS